MSSRRNKIKFDLDDQHDQEEDDPSREESPQPKTNLIHKFFKKWKYRSPSSEIAKHSKNNKSGSSKEKQKLTRYLSEQRQIVQMNVKIDDEEQRLLNILSGEGAVDIDKYFKFPELKAKDKLWKIPYTFSNDDDSYDDDEQTKVINRFGEGVSDGCNIGLNLPKTKKDKQIFKNWDEIQKCSDDVLKQFYNVRLSRNRRGSILQPRHVYLSPNPEVGCGDKFMLSKSINLRDWSSEIFIGSTGSEKLLETEYRMNILNNHSMCDLSNMLYPEMKNSWTIEPGMLTDSDVKYIQAMSQQRRQSLVPPNFSGEPTSSLGFRRQSFAGGQVWSTKVEKNRQKSVYQQKVALFNPDYHPRVFHRLDSIDTIELTINNQHDDDDDELCEISNYPYFDPKDDEQARLFAIELLLIVRKYFNSIKSSEIINFMLCSGQNIMNACEHIKGLLHFQNRIIRLIATYVLRDGQQLQQRVDAILFFINVIRKLHQMDNWHSVNLVTQSLQCPSVVRLKETWRKITFKYPEDYLFFIEISEVLAAGKQWETYEAKTRFIPLFDDAIEMIKEECGLIIVKSSQHRLHSTWSNHQKDDEQNTVKWIHDQVGSLMKDCTTTDKIAPAKQNTTNIKKKNGFFNRTFHLSYKKMKNKNQTGNVSGQEERRRTFEDLNPNMDDDNDENGVGDDGDYNIYQRRLLIGSDVMIRRTSRTKNHRINSIGASGVGTGSGSAGSLNLPSCKKYWSIAEYHKLKPEVRELVKQQIVRTLVRFQKKTFYVFEDRDPEIRNFLLNAKCESMNECMLRSRTIENARQFNQNELLEKRVANREEFEIEQDKQDNQEDLVENESSNQHGDNNQSINETNDDNDRLKSSLKICIANGNIGQSTNVKQDSTNQQQIEEKANQFEEPCSPKNTPKSTRRNVQTKRVMFAD